MARGWFICGGSSKDTVPRPPLRESEGDEVSVKPAAAGASSSAAAAGLTLTSSPSLSRRGGLGTVSLLEPPQMNQPRAILPARDGRIIARRAALVPRVVRGAAGVRPTCGRNPTKRVRSGVRAVASKA